MTQHMKNDKLQLKNSHSMYNYFIHDVYMLRDIQIVWFHL